MRIYQPGILEHALSRANEAVLRYSFTKQKGQKVLKVSEIDLHEMVIESMCQFPYELRFGQIVDALCSYLMNQPEDVRKAVKHESLDLLHSVLDDLVESGDLKLREARVTGYAIPVEYFSLRQGLMKEVHFSLVRDHDVPLNYRKDV